MKKVVSSKNGGMVSKAMTKGQGMKMDKMPAGKGKMGMKYCPKISKIG